MRWSSRSRAPATGCANTPSCCPSTCARALAPARRQSHQLNAADALRRTPDPNSGRSPHPQTGEFYFDRFEENSSDVDTLYMSGIMKTVMLGQEAGSASARSAGHDVVGSTVVGAVMATVVWAGLSMRPTLWMLMLWLVAAALWAGARLFQ